MLNGDILTDIDLRPVLQRHQRRRAAATLVLVNVADTRAYGVVELDAGGESGSFTKSRHPA